MRVSGEDLKIQVNDISVNYNDHGPQFAPVIIFIHGFPFTKNIWTLQAELFKANYRVITYDVRGHGETGRGNKKFSIDLFAEDLIGIMDALEIEKAIICGLSMGGYIALNAVQRYSKRFNGLVLSGTRCASDSPEVRDKRFVSIKDLNEKGIEFYADENLKRLFAPVSFTTRREEVKATRSMILNTSPDVISDTLVALAERRETCSRLGEIAVPTLVIVGKEDKVTPPSESDTLHESIKNSVIRKIDYAGHLANLENTHDYNQALKNFISEVCERMALSPHCEEG